MKTKMIALAASMVVASLSAGCAEIPSSSLRVASGPVPQTCGAMSNPEYSESSSQNDCTKIYSELKGQDTVTVEFSDRYQAVAVPIQVYTMSWITHVDFVLPDGRLLGATPLGVRVRHWTPAIHTVRYTFHANAEQVLGYALSQVGKPYDYVGLSGYALKMGFLHQPGSWFCSALVEAAALKGGVDLSGRSPHMTSPARLEQSVLLTKVTRQPSEPAYTTEAQAQPQLRAQQVSLNETPSPVGF